MANVAEIYDKVTGSDHDHTLILNTRCQLIYPFSAPNWVDLRVGFFVSITDVTNDDLITGLSESIGEGFSNADDFWWLGIKTNNDALPLDPNTGFIGYTNSPAAQGFGSEILSSDEGIGTTNTDCWRVRPTRAGSGNNLISAQIIDGAVPAAPAFIGVQPHFAQDASGTGGYATLLMLRITRPSSGSDTLTVKIKQGTNSGDVLFTDAPTLDLLETNLGDYPTTVQTRTTSRMEHIPDALYAYWPFHSSRLRLHCLGFTKFH